MWHRIVSVDKATTIEDVELDEELHAVIVHVRPRHSTKHRCERCGARTQGYDRGEKRRRWRWLDLGVSGVFTSECSAHAHGTVLQPLRVTIPWRTLLG